MTFDPTLLHPDWIIPNWPAPAHVHAVFTTRVGGVSLPPFASLNLGNHVSDSPEAVSHNRQFLGSTIGARPVFMDQVHGVNVVPLSTHTPNGVAADAAMTQEAGVACTVMVADCLPILLCEPQTGRIAALHAGWRGLAGVNGHGVVEATLKAFGVQADIPKSTGAMKLIAWLGPCIGPDAFEVGDEVRAAFVTHQTRAQSCFKPGQRGKWYADLAALARIRLADQGVQAVFGNDSTEPWCTVINSSRFFSFRRDGICGRHAACVWRSQ